METIKRPDKMNTMVANFVTNILNSATTLHLVHLSITGPSSYAAHKALQEYYDGVPDIIDSLVEQYQGMKGSLLSYNSSSVKVLKTVQESYLYLTELYNMTEDLSKNCNHSELLAILDELKSLINSVKYKLLFLK